MSGSGWGWGWRNDLVLAVVWGGKREGRKGTVEGFQSSDQDSEVSGGTCVEKADLGPGIKSFLLVSLRHI